MDGSDGTRAAAATEWRVRAATAAGRVSDPPAALRDRDDSDLVAAAVAGSRAAFDAIVERHQRPIVHLCYRYVGNRDDAADLAQEVFLRAYRGLGRFKGASSLATWLYRIAVNVCLNQMSGRTIATTPLEHVREVRDDTADPAAGLLAAERAAQVRRAVARLPPKQRATLVLRAYHDLPHQEIAAILGGSVGAVKANFFHALRNLARLLREERAGERGNGR